MAEDTQYNDDDDQLLFEEDLEPSLSLPYSPFISYTAIDPPGLNGYGCLVHMKYSPLDGDGDGDGVEDIPPPSPSSTPQHDHQLYLHELWKNYSILIIKGDKPLTALNQLKIFRFYQQILATESNIIDEYSPTRYDDLSSQYKQLQQDYYLSQNNYHDAKLTVSHLQDDLLIEKQKQNNILKQLTTFHELEEYSAGLRDECSKLEENILELKMKLQDMERSSRSLNLLNHDLQTEKMKLQKDLQDKDLKIESLEKELWNRQLKVSSSESTRVGSGVLCTEAHVGISESRKNDSETSDVDHSLTPVTTPRSPGLTPPRPSFPQFSETPNHPPEGPPDGAPPTDSSITVPHQPMPEYAHAGSGAETINVAIAEDPLAPNLSRMMQEMEESNRRLLSRLKFLDSRLEIKEEALKKLNGRIEVCLPSL
jgi:hypothetical protein